MRKIAFVLILAAGLASTTFAQTEQQRSRRVETSSAPKVAPTPRSSGDESGNSNSNSRQSQLPPFLGGSARTDKSDNNSRTRPQINQSPTSSIPVITNKSSQKKPPVLISPSGLPASPSETSPAPARTAETASDDDEVIKVETELVTIPVTVLDRQGRFMTGLRQSDFRISEDGSSQEVAYFAATEQAFTVVLLLDVSTSTKFKIDEIQDAAIAFINQLKQNDRVMVISFDDNVNVLSEPTSDRRQLYDAVRRANFNGGTSLYDAVDFAINRRLNRIEGRKAIVLFTDGVDTTSKRAGYQSTLRDSEELDATVYPVYYNTYNAMQTAGSGGGGNYPRRNPYPRRGGAGGIGGIIGIILGGGNIQIGNGGGTSGSSRGDYERGERYLEDLAARTGGRKYDADSSQNLSAAFSNIAEELRRQYSIGYYPTATGQTGQRKQIKVSVDRPDSIVRARDSYIVGEQKPNSGR